MISQAILTTRATEALLSTTILRTLHEVKDGSETTNEDETNESFQERKIIFAAHRRRQTMTLEKICDPSFDFLVLIFGPISIIFKLVLVFTW